MNKNDANTEHSLPISSSLRIWSEPSLIYLSGDKTEKLPLHILFDNAMDQIHAS